MLNLCVYVSVNTSPSSNHISTRFETFFLPQEDNCCQHPWPWEPWEPLPSFQPWVQSLEVQTLFYVWFERERKKKVGEFVKGQVSEKKFQMDEL